MGLEEIFIQLEDALKKNKEEMESLQKELVNFETIYFYGTENFAVPIVTGLTDYLSEKRCYFVDRNPLKHGKEICNGYICIPMDELQQADEKSVIIITNYQFVDHIHWDLIRKGIGRASIWKQYCISFAETYYIEELLSNKNRIKAFEGILKDELSRKILFKNISFWIHPYNVRELGDERELIIGPGELISELRDKSANAFNKCIACGYIMDVLTSYPKRLFNEFDRIDIYEINDVYCEELKAENKKDEVKYINACVGAEHETLEYGQYNESADKNWVIEHTCADTIDIVALDDIYLSDSDEANRIGMVYFHRGNMLNDALRGMEKLISRDKPILIIKGYNWDTPGIIELMDLGYKFIFRRGFVLGEMLCAYCEG